MLVCILYGLEWHKLLCNRGGLVEDEASWVGHTVVCVGCSVHLCWLQDRGGSTMNIEELRTNSPWHRCDCCQHLVRDCDCVVVRFNRLASNCISVDTTKYRVCYKCANIVEWHWQDKRDSFNVGVSNKEQAALINGLF